MCVNSSPPTFAVRSSKATGRFAAPQPASNSTATLIHVHRLAVRIRRVEVRRDPHRDTDAPVACRVGRNGWVAVNCIAAREVHRVVEGPEGTGVESDDLAVDGEAADGRELAREPGRRDGNDQ